VQDDDSVMPAPKPILLVVDDEPENLRFLERVFRDLYTVLTAEDGATALGMLRKHDVKVIITDQRMPKMSGTQLLEQSLAINPKIVKIILSGYTDTADILNAVNVCKINHYIVKPASLDKLRTVVAEALELVPKSARYD
jgi:response regulator RpfG family c-di-GMP phosphodiesterase